jgi:hypothetical protein
MFHKFKISTCVFILCLFGLTLKTVSPVFAEDSAAFIQCQQIKPQGQFEPMKQKKDCFRDLGRQRIAAAKAEADRLPAEQAEQAELTNPSAKCELKSSSECAEVFCSKFPEISGTNAGCQAGYINGWFCGVDDCLSGAKCEMESYECAPVFCSKFPEGKGLGANPGCQAGYIKGWYRETK